MKLNKLEEYMNQLLLKKIMKTFFNHYLDGVDVNKYKKTLNSYISYIYIFSSTKNQQKMTIFAEGKGF